MLCCFVGVPSLVLGIIALTKVRTDLAETQRLTKIGWIVLGVLAAVAVVAFVVVAALAVTRLGQLGRRPDDRHPRAGVRNNGGRRWR